MKIFLLTHERECDRKTNTGKLALESCGEIVSRVIWKRVEPDAHLVSVLEHNKTALVFPNDQLQTSYESVPVEHQFDAYDNFVIIDATWQEAKKMFNQSAYLKKAPRLTLETENTSLFTLRKNQPVGCLCTAESVVALLKAKGENNRAEKVFSALEIFLKKPI